MFPATDLYRANQSHIARRDGPNSTILIDALCHLIDRKLALCHPASAHVIAARVIDDLKDCGADHRIWGSAERLTVYGVQATTTAAGPAQLLRNWQTAARRQRDLQPTPHPSTGAAA